MTNTIRCFGTKLEKINKCEGMYLYSDKRKIFTYLPHKDALKENLTIEENLKIWSSISFEKFSYKKLQSIFDYFHLKNIKQNLVGNLSQGQRKKVSLTKLLLTNTKLWLLDEPFNGLDSNSVKKTKKLIENHLMNGGSTLLTNHINLNLKNSKNSRLI